MALLILCIIIQGEGPYEKWWSTSRLTSTDLCVVSDDLHPHLDESIFCRKSPRVVIDQVAILFHELLGEVHLV